MSHKIVGSGPGLLLAHGAGGGIDANFPFLNELAENRTVVAPDYPGSGATPKAEKPLELDALADELVATAVDGGVESFAILGYSLGSAVAVRAAARHPERVTALVLTAGLAHVDRYARLTIDLWQRLLEGPDRESFARFLLLNCFTPETVETLGDDAHQGVLDGVPVGTGDHIDLLRTVDVRADLPRITVPTLVVATTRDTPVPPHHSRELAAGISGARIVEIDSGHLIGTERPGPWLRAVREFLDD